MGGCRMNEWMDDAQIDGRWMDGGLWMDGWMMDDGWAVDGLIDG